MAQLKSGSIDRQRKEVQTAPLSSVVKAREIATILKDWISSGRFLLSRPAETLPDGSE